MKQETPPNGWKIYLDEDEEVPQPLPDPPRLTPPLPYRPQYFQEDFELDMDLFIGHNWRDTADPNYRPHLPSRDDGP